MGSTKTVLEKQLKAAADNLKHLQSARRDALEAVQRQHDPAIQDAERTVAKLRHTIRQAKSDAMPDHEWEGCKVAREVKITGRFSSRVIDTKIERGIVYTYRQGMDAGPGHRSYNPPLGTVFVRLLKKDGTPGLKSKKFHRPKSFLDHTQEIADWKLVKED